MRIGRRIWIAAAMITFGVVLMATGVFMYRSLDRMVAEEEERLYQIVGEAAGGARMPGAVADVMKGKVNREKVDRGREVLGVYGFSEEFFSAGRQKAEHIKTLLLLGSGLIAAAFLLAMFCMKKERELKERRRLDEITQLVGELSRGNYTLEIPDCREHEMGRLYTKLEQLRHMILLGSRRLEKEKEETKELVTDISHQLKTPLASLETCFAILREEDLKPEEREEFMERSGLQIERLKALIYALVNISRMESGLIHIQKEVLDIRETVVQAVSSIYIRAEEKKIQLQLDEGPPILLPHDRKWTKEAVANVLENGVKYSPSGSCVRVRVGRLGQYVRIEIEDEGIGIPKEEYPKVFQRFYRGKTSGVKEEEGSGVGLYLTRKILEEQQGSIRAAGKTDGSQGAVFFLQLPLKA